MPTVMLLLAVTAFITTIVSMMGRCPIGVPVLCLCLIELLHLIPLGK